MIHASAHFLSNVRIKQGVALLLIYLYNISPCAYHDKVL